MILARCAFTLMGLTLTGLLLAACAAVPRPSTYPYSFSRRCKRRSTGRPWPCRWWPVCRRARILSLAAQRYRLLVAGIYFGLRRGELQHLLHADTNGRQIYMQGKILRMAGRGCPKTAKRG